MNEDLPPHGIHQLWERLVRLETKVEPLEKLIYGLVGLVLISFVGALIALVLR